MLGTLTPDQVVRVLHHGMIGRIGCHADGETYVVPVTYVYDGDAVYGHTGEGRKVAMMRKNPVVCFEVDEMDNLSNWRSVIATGRYEELHGEDAGRCMQLLVDRFLPLMTSESATPSHGMQAAHRADTTGHTPVMYRLRLSDKTGRFEKR